MSERTVKEEGSWQNLTWPGIALCNSFPGRQASLIPRRLFSANKNTSLLAPSYIGSLIPGSPILHSAGSGRPVSLHCIQDSMEEAGGGLRVKGYFTPTSRSAPAAPIGLLGAPPAKSLVQLQMACVRLGQGLGPSRSAGSCLSPLPSAGPPTGLPLPSPAPKCLPSISTLPLPFQPATLAKLSQYFLTYLGWPGGRIWSPWASKTTS